MIECNAALGWWSRHPQLPNRQDFERRRGVWKRPNRRHPGCEKDTAATKILWRAKTMFDLILANARPDRNHCGLSRSSRLIKVAPRPRDSPYARAQHQRSPISLLKFTCHPSKRLQINSWQDPPAAGKESRAAATSGYPIRATTKKSCHGNNFKRPMKRAILLLGTILSCAFAWSIDYLLAKFERFINILNWLVYTPDTFCRERADFQAPSFPWSLRCGKPCHIFYNLTDTDHLFQAPLTTGSMSLRIWSKSMCLLLFFWYKFWGCNPSDPASLSLICALLALLQRLLIFRCLRLSHKSTLTHSEPFSAPVAAKQRSNINCFTEFIVRSWVSPGSYHTAKFASLRSRPAKSS